jgi:transglutaminase-like putative cysteine protease
MRWAEAIRRANEAKEPEDSVRFRVACTGTVLVAIAASASVSEVSRGLAGIAMLLVPLGMTFSYFTRNRPPGLVKVLVAMGAVAAVVWFFHAVTASPPSDITAVEDPLTVLFIAIQVVHSFHVPARRDLMFSLGASAGLMAVGAAQAVDLAYGWYALLWLAFGLWALVEMWASASGGGRVSAPGLGTTLGAVTLATTGIFLLLPAPTVGVRVNFLSRPGAGGPVAVPGALAGDGGQPAELSKPGAASGPTRVGGYLGFANSLDTALRGRLGHAVVMWVRAERPSYWVGETFNTWDGQSWTNTAGSSRSIPGGSPFVVPTPDSNGTNQRSDLQTFFVNTATADLVFHAESASEVWFPSSTLFYSNEGTLVSPVGIGKGAVYTVDSQVTAPDPDQLRQVGGESGLSPAAVRQYTELPHPYPEVKALAETITAGDGNTYDRVQSLISWIGANTHYSTDIPPLPRGTDTVDEFLFGNRVGFCEQISTSLAVMLRTLGVPVRETVGYVPGPYNPVTDLYEVQADDAHAWVQVWFPGLGWQSFDPTAVVPLSNPSPGATALGDMGRALGRVPYVPVGATLLVLAGVAGIVRWRRSRPANWVERVTRDVERAGKKAGRPRRPSETFTEYAGALDELCNDDGQLNVLASHVMASAYGGREPPAELRRQLLIVARHKRARGARRDLVGAGGSRPGSHL